LAEAPANFAGGVTFKTRMAGTVIVGVYETRGDAEAARARLIERGIPGERIHIEQQTNDSDVTKRASHQRDVDEPLPEDRGI